MTQPDPAAEWRHHRNQWLTQGMAAGWCSPAWCDVHDAPAMSPAELVALDAGEEPCVMVVRVMDEPGQVAELTT